ncbi:tetratricopeptide repeat protein [Helicobacter muridarum]|uniref:Periplasmic protein n=1 Tax=Helicobacter muridarum TaxID=216 RepID=A0A377PX74_9HELI|nr:tetratricopeptide repeat protein [Helicobacter muridarum]TLE01299.1 tetratricopeptide repeat protein [Helicobacter muridarum]STQ87167.1 periplasmic protein [Helicobacter muridarum]
MRFILISIIRFWIFPIFSILVLHKLYAEPSAFEMQGSATKKDMRDLKELADFTRSMISDFHSKIADLEQAVEGLKTVYDGIGLTSRQDTLLIKSQMDKISNLQDAIEHIRSSQKFDLDAKQKLEAQIEANAQNIVQINQKIDKLSEAFLQANSEILKQIEVLSQQAIALQSSIQSIQIQPQEAPEQETVIEDSNVNKKYNFSDDNEENLKTAKKLLRDKNYDDSKAYFEYLISKKYAVAESNYYLGEIYYAYKQYNEALPYYKISVGLDSKAKYMSVLLWHTAWSFKYLGDNENYRKFLQTLVTLFPNSEQGRKAKDILSK